MLLGDAEARRRPRSATPAPSSSAPWSPVAAGDYATGGNHVLPTGGWARSVGGLGLETFLKPVTVQRLTAEGLARIRPDGRGARRRRGHAGARRGGAAMRALAPEFRPYTLGAADATRSRGSPASTRRRCCASTRTRRRCRCLRRGPGTIAGALARDQRLPGAAATAPLRRAIADYAGVEPENVVLGAGADDLILLCARAFAGPGDTIAIPRRADLPALPHRRAARRRRGRRRRARSLTFACRPNNPTGALDAAARTARPLVVDEAYFEYCGETAVR